MMSVIRIMGLGSGDPGLGQLILDSVKIIPKHLMLMEDLGKVSV